MWGSAPGRLDLLGGVADYSGALVLEMPTRQGTRVVAQPDDALVVGPVVLSPSELEALARFPYEEIRRAAGGLPPLDALRHRSRHRAGAAGMIDPPRVRLEITSDLPASVGVASSAALEVATARALGAPPSTRSARRAVSGGGEPRGGRTVRDHGSGRGRARDTRDRAADPVPAGVGASPVAVPSGSRSSVGRPEHRTMSAACPTNGPGPPPSWGSGWWRRRRRARGPG